MDGQIDQPLATGVVGDEGGEIVGFATIHRPLQWWMWEAGRQAREEEERRVVQHMVCLKV